MSFLRRASCGSQKNSRRRSGKHDSSKLRGPLHFHRLCKVEQLEERALLSIGPAINNALVDPLLTAWTAFQSGDKGEPGNPLTKVGCDLAQIYADYQYSTANSSGSSMESVLSNDVTFISVDITEKTVLIDASSVTNDPSSLEADLAKLSFVETGVYGRMVSGWLPIDQISDLSILDDLKVASAVITPQFNVGSVTSQGDRSMRSDIARTTYGVDGSGVKVGVLSDSFNALNGYATDVTSGDLPAGVQIIQDYTLSDATDEGRAMAQIVHDVAPGSSLAFATADNGQASFASNIQALATAGCQVITDDVIYFAEPFFQDGVIAQAVNTVASQGVSYFSSAGNQDRQAYQAAFTPGSTYTNGQISSASGAPHFYGGVAQDFDPGTGLSNFQSFTLANGGYVILEFQWDQPFASVSGVGSANDVDIYLLNSTKTQVISGSAGNNLGVDPSEFFYYQNTSGSSQTYNLMIVSRSGSTPGLVKYVNLGSNMGSVAFATNSGSTYGHANTIGAASVGAAYYGKTPRYGVSPPVLESFSSSGGTPILFTPGGTRLSSPIDLQKTNFVAPDGVSTTVSGFSSFYGTSAAAPHAAGVAALMKQYNGTLAPAQIYADLESTAIPMANPFSPGYNYAAGAGLIQADAALNGLITQSLSINDVTVTEGNSGIVNATFTVTLSAASTQTVTVNYTTANQTAVAPGDYTGASGTLTFDPGQTTKPITVQVNGDNLVEFDETFLVELSGATNATIADGEGVGTINNDDITNIIINDVSALEGSPSGTTAFIFTVTLSNPIAANVTVDYATADNTATTADNDYSATTGTLIFTPGGSLSQPVTVNVTKDAIPESNETFYVNLSNAKFGGATDPSRAKITDAQGLGTILNDDNYPPVNIVPGPQQTPEDVPPIVFSTANGNLISMYDPGEGPDTIEQVTLTATNGTLTLGSFAGLTFLIGDGTADAQMRFQGRISDLQAALEGLQFLPTPDFNGSASVQIVSNDLGHTGYPGPLEDSDTVPITVWEVNDSPLRTAPANLTLINVNEDSHNYTSVSLGLSSLSYAPGPSTATDEASQTLTYKLTKIPRDTEGQQYLQIYKANGVTRVNEGDLVTLAELRGLRYKTVPNLNGSGNLEWTVTDNGTTHGAADPKSLTESLTITINAVNDPPVAFDDYPVTPEDTVMVINAADLAANDSPGPTNESTQTLTVISVMPTAQTLGTVELIDGNVIYRAPENYHGDDVFQYVVQDNGTTDGSPDFKTAIGTVHVTVTEVNDAPVANPDTVGPTNEDTPLTISLSSLTANDDKGAPDESWQIFTNFEVRATGNTHGTVVPPSGAIPGNIVYTPDHDYNSLINGGPVSFEYRILDNGITDGQPDPQWSNWTTVSLTVTAVNDAPILTVPGQQTVNEDTNLTITGIHMTDVDAYEGTGTVTATLSVQHGTLTLPGQPSGPIVTLTGSLNDVNAALAGLVYRGNQDYNGSENIHITANDLGNTGTGGQLWAVPQDIPITVVAVNDLPVLAVPGPQTTNEDTSLGISGIHVADVDVNETPAPNNTVQVTLGVLHGTLTLTNGMTGRTIVYTDTLANVNAALSVVTYAPDLNYNNNTLPPGDERLSVSVNDLGHTGLGGPQYDGPETIAITVSAVNDAPVLTLPQLQVVDEDTNLAIEGINVTDVDVVEPRVSQVQMTLQANHGTITLAATAGLTFETGNGIGNETMTFMGSLADVNAAVTVLTYRGNLNYNGPDTILVYVNDQGNTGSGGPLSDNGTIDVSVSAVNDPPVLTLPASKTGLEDTDIQITGTYVSDPDAAEGTDMVQVTLSASHGTLTLRQPPILPFTFTVGDGTNDPTMTFTGLLPDVNLALNSLVYHGNLNYNGVDAIQVNVNDQGNFPGPALPASGAITVVVNAVNDAPILALPGSLSTNEDTPMAIPGVSVSDVDVAEGTDMVQLILWADHGTLNVSAIIAPLANVNAALAGLVYSPNPNYNGSDMIHVLVNDQGNTGAGGIQWAAGSINVQINAVNDPPILTVPGPQSAIEDTDKTITGIGVTDVDVNEGTGMVQMSLSAGHGVLTLASTHGLTFTQGDGTADPAMTFTGSLVDVNVALCTIIYRGNPNYNGPDTIHLNVNDLGNTGLGGPLSANGTIAVTVSAVDDAPVLTLPQQPQVASEDTDALITGISVTDVDVNETQGGQMLMVLQANHGVLSLAQTTGLTFITGDGTKDETMKFTGSLADVNAALATLTYHGNLNYNGPDSILVYVSDQGNTGAGGPLSANGTIAVTVTAVDNPPVLTLPGPLTALEDTNMPMPGSSVSDPDVDETPPPNNTLSMTVGADHGIIITPSGSPSFTGTIPQVNAWLAALVYRGDQDYNGPDTIHVMVNDLGHTGAGGPQSTSGTIAVTVISVNDAPAGTDNTVTTNEDTPYIFTAADFGFTDPQDNSPPSSVPPNNFAGVWVDPCANSASHLYYDGVGTVSVTIYVPRADIDAGKLSFIPAPDENGVHLDSFTFRVRDDGGTANGGQDTDPTRNTMWINVRSVDDAPEGIDNTVIVLEDHTYAFKVSDFPFTDPHDNPPNNLAGVWVTPCQHSPSDPHLYYNGVPVTSTIYVSASDLTAGKLTFTPPLNANWNAPWNFSDSFTFAVKDDGGTANGGQDTDPTPNTMTINVMPVNDRPVPFDDQTRTTENVSISFADIALIGNDSKGPADESWQVLTLTDVGWPMGDPNADVPINLVDHTQAYSPTTMGGTVTLAGHTITYTPPTGFVGTDTFAYTVYDDGGTDNGAKNWNYGVVTVTVSAVIDTHTWDGGSTANNLWTTAANWVGDVAPTAGDNLVFPANAARKTNVNNFASGTVFGSIVVSCNGYHLLNSGMQSSTVNVQTNSLLETQSINTGTLTIGAGAVVTISAIPTGVQITAVQNLTVPVPAALPEEMPTATAAILSPDSAISTDETVSGTVDVATTDGALFSLTEANTSSGDTVIMAKESLTALITCSQPSSEVDAQPNSNIEVDGIAAASLPVSASEVDCIISNSAGSEALAAQNLTVVAAAFLPETRPLVSANTLPIHEILFSQADQNGLFRADIADSSAENGLTPRLITAPASWITPKHALSIGAAWEPLKTEVSSFTLLIPRDETRGIEGKWSGNFLSDPLPEKSSRPAGRSAATSAIAAARDAVFQGSVFDRELICDTWLSASQPTKQKLRSLADLAIQQEEDFVAEGAEERLLLV